MTDHSEFLTLDNTAIVLDSTCDAPEGFLDRPGLFMVPLKVHFGDQMYRDGVDMTSQEFFARLEQADVLPTTSQPTAGEFVATYEEARRQYEHVFSLHISGEMSGRTAVIIPIPMNETDAIASRTRAEAKFASGMSRPKNAAMTANTIAARTTP